MDPVQLSLTDVRSLALLLGSDEPALLTSVLASLAKHIDGGPPNRAKLLSMNVMPQLVEIADSNKDLNVRKNAVSCISALTESTEPHADFRSKRLVDVLVSLLAVPDVQVQEEAASALGNIARDFSMVSVIRTAALKPLVMLLTSPDPDTKKNSAYALSMLLEDFSARYDLRASGGIPPLIDLCTSEYPEIQEHALAALKKCGKDAQNRIEMKKSLCHKRLLDVVSNEQCTVTIPALECLQQCLDDASNHQQLRDAGALGSLVTLLSHTSTTVISHAALAIAAMARAEMFQQDLLKSNALDILIQRLSDPDTNVKRYAIAATASCCLNPKMRQRVRTNADCVRTIVDLLGNEDSACVMYTSECITVICEDADGRTEVIRANGVQALIAALKSPDPHTQASICQALSKCLQEADGRQALLDGQGLEPMVNLLKSPDLEVIRCAAWALGMAAASEPLAVEAGRLGSYDLLLNTARTKGNKAKFANDALAKLLNYNLPGKYWVYGRLAQEDKLGAQFYDLGWAPPAEGPLTLPVLADLQAMPVDKKHDIILVSRDDKRLQELAEQARKLVPDAQAKGQSSASTAATSLQRIAELVSQSMGGPIADEDVAQVPFKFKLAELKLQRQSNVIPLGLIERGVHAHRSLLFKFLCDGVGLDVGLVRGDYGRVWNDAQLKGAEIGITGAQAMCEVTVVVDVMTQPGRLLVQGTSEADRYTRI
ncbi:hypothetical protein RI367_000194 [Sorochytrium milnesiophthora]